MRAANIALSLLCIRTPQHLHARADMSGQRSCDASTSRVVLIGRQASGRHTLLRELCPSSSTSDRGHHGTLALNTKYYTAEVHVQVCDTDHQAGDIVKGAHGVLAVIDGSNHESFTAVQRVLDECDTEAADVRLLVCNKADMCTLSPKWHEDVRTWCIDNLFEFVLAAAAHPAVDAALSQHAEDPQGLARIQAALEATMWPNMVLKSSSREAHDDNSCAAGATSRCPPPCSTAAPTICSTAATTAAEVLCDAQPSSKPTDAHNAEYPAPTSNSSTPSSSSADAAAASNPFLPSNAEGSWGEEDAPDNSDDEELMAGVKEFEAVVAELSRARDKAAMLSDQERRAYAASMAARFADMLGLQDDDTESDDQQH